MDTTLNQIRNRPRFKLATTDNLNDVRLKMKQHAAALPDKFCSNINTEVSTFSVKTERDYFWKPYLNIRTETEGEMTMVRGVFGPSAAIWTLFMFVYFIFGIGLMVCLTMWLVARQIGSSEYGWAFPLTLVCAACLVINYILAKVGQKKAAREMKLLRQLVEDIFDKELRVY